MMEEVFPKYFGEVYPILRDACTIDTPRAPRGHPMGHIWVASRSFLGHLLVIQRSSGDVAVRRRIDVAGSLQDDVKVTSSDDKNVTKRQRHRDARVTSLCFQGSNTVDLPTCQRLGVYYMHLMNYKL